MLSLAVIIGGFAAGGAFGGLGEAIQRGIASARAPTPAPAPAPTPAAPAPAPAIAPATPPPPPAPAAQTGVPSGYILEDCQQGTGATGKSIYFRVPAEKFARFVCVHKVGESPNITYGSASFYARLASESGNHCAFSTSDKNIGCALEPITENDLMEPPPSASQAGIPAGYVVEKACTANTFKGVPLYSNRTDPIHFICVHPAGKSPTLSPGDISEGNPSINPYCASLHAAIYCSATRPITQDDLR